MKERGKAVDEEARDLAFDPGEVDGVSGIDRRDDAVDLDPALFGDARNGRRTDVVNRFPFGRSVYRMLAQRAAISGQALS